MSAVNQNFSDAPRASSRALVAIAIVNPNQSEGYSGEIPLALTKLTPDPVMLSSMIMTYQRGYPVRAALTVIINQISITLIRF